MKRKKRNILFLMSTLFHGLTTFSIGFEILPVFMYMLSMLPIIILIVFTEEE